MDLSPDDQRFLAIVPERAGVGDGHDRPVVARGADQALNRARDPPPSAQDGWEIERDLTRGVRVGHAQLHTLC